MSAIAGLFKPGRRSESYIELMMDRMAHRIPGRRHIWKGQGVSLGQGISSDHSTTGHLYPLRSEETNHLKIVADARIDNRIDVLRCLGLYDGCPGLTDEELILAAYRRWNEQCPHYLIGDFAFAIWDERIHTLFCARDALGVRPFYYSFQGGAFAFATEIKALLELSWVTRSPNEHKIADYLMRMHEDTEQTFYAGIQRLKPAHSLTVTSEGVQTKRYWSLDPQKMTTYKTDVEYAAEYQLKFVEAVRCRIKDKVGIGSLLSGGLDSSSVTCVARELLGSNNGDPLDVFSLVFDTVPESDERPFIEMVVEKGKLLPHYINGDRLNPFASLDRMFFHVEEPFFTSNLFLYWELFRKFEAQNLRVMLDGFAGDQVVSHGSRYLTELAQAGRLIRLKKEMDAVAGQLGGSRRRSYPHMIRQFILDPLVKEPVKSAWSRMTRTELAHHPCTWYVNEHYLNRLKWLDRARLYHEHIYRTPRTGKAEHLMDLNSGALSGVFEVLNKAAAPFSITPGLPFADRRLVEYCLSVPTNQKYKNGWTRVYARAGMKEYLPADLRMRYDKKYLHYNFYHCLYEMARKELDYYVFERMTEVKEYINLEALQTMHMKICAYGKRSADRYADEIQAIWSAVVLTHWIGLERRA